MNKISPLGTLRVHEVTRCANTIKNESDLPALIIHHLLLTCQSNDPLYSKQLFCDDCNQITEKNYELRKFI